MATSKVPTFIDALKPLLEARAGLAGVTIFTAHPGDEIPPEAIVIDRADTAQEWAAIGRRGREETFTAIVVMHIEKAGAGDAVAKEARDRLYALKAELEGTLRDDPTVSDSVRTAAYVSDRLRQGTGAGTRWADLEASIECQVRL